MTTKLGRTGRAGPGGVSAVTLGGLQRRPSVPADASTATASRRRAIAGLRICGNQFPGPMVGAETTERAESCAGPVDPEETFMRAPGGAFSVLPGPRREPLLVPESYLSWNCLPLRDSRQPWTTLDQGCFAYRRRGTPLSRSG